MPRSRWTKFPGTVPFQPPKIFSAVSEDRVEIVEIPDLGPSEQQVIDAVGRFAEKMEETNSSRSSLVESSPRVFLQVHNGTEEEGERRGRSSKGL